MISEIAGRVKEEELNRLVADLSTPFTTDSVVLGSGSRPVSPTPSPDAGPSSPTAAVAVPSPKPDKTPSSPARSKTRSPTPQSIGSPTTSIKSKKLKSLTDSFGKSEVKHKFNKKSPNNNSLLNSLKRNKQSESSRKKKGANRPEEGIFVETDSSDYMDSIDGDASPVPAPLTTTNSITVPSIVPHIAPETSNQHALMSPEISPNGSTAPYQDHLYENPPQEMTADEPQSEHIYVNRSMVPMDASNGDVDLDAVPDMTEYNPTPPNSPPQLYQNLGMETPVLTSSFSPELIRESDVIMEMSNIEEDDDLLVDKLKPDVDEVMRRISFYLRQDVAHKNVKFCYEMLEKIAIKDAHGVPLLIQLLKSSNNFEILELVTGVFWNLSSSEQLKPQILKQALEPLVNTVIVPQSGWNGSQIKMDKIRNIDCTTVFRNATGCLRNLSSVGQEGRQLMRICPALVDSLLFTLRSVQGKNDVDNKAVENSVCVLRNLSYKLDEEVSAEHKYGQVEDWRSKGLGGGQFRQKNPDEDGCFKRKKGAKKQKGKENLTPLPEHTSGVGLLWQPATVRVYLDLLLECSNPETLEGAAGALQNLTASNWEAGQVIREAVRKEKGLAVITSLLRMQNDNVVRSTAICLRNLAADLKNKALLGENALPDLVRRLPGPDGVEGVTDVTIGALLSTLHELLQNAPDSCRTFKDIGGIPRLMDIIRTKDLYSTQCLVMCQKILRILYDIKDLRKHLKHEGWSAAMLQNMPNMDRTDGLEYDESRNQFKTSYNVGLDHNHNTISRGGRYPLSPGLDPRLHAMSPYQHPYPPEYPSVQKQEFYVPQRAATIGRSFDPSFEYHKPDRDIPRGQSLPGGRHLQPCNTSFGVADSWV